MCVYIEKNVRRHINIYIYIANGYLYKLTGRENVLFYSLLFEFLL